MTNPFSFVLNAYRDDKRRRGSRDWIASRVAMYDRLVRILFVPVLFLLVFGLAMSAFAVELLPSDRIRFVAGFAIPYCAFLFCAHTREFWRIFLY